MTYENRKEIVTELIQDKSYKPMKIKEIAMVLNVPKTDRDILDQIMVDLVKEGLVLKTKKGKFILPSSVKLLVGNFVGNEKGFGFVEIEGEDHDIFIPAKYVNSAFNGDKVAVRLNKMAKNGKRCEGEIIEIIDRGKREIVGTYHKNSSFGFVVADNKKMSKDIFISKSNDMNAISGHKVVVKILKWGDEDKKPEGEIVEIIGHVSDPETDILAIVRNYDIPHEFPENVLKQVEAIPNEVPEEDKKGRLDLRNIQTVTIDGEDAKDLDDAITIENKEGYFTLGVHIADVTNYVTEDSPLDQEAIKRGTSVYLVDRVIPMLPRKLSNGLCSLNYGEDRLALSCIMDADYKGNILTHSIYETVINVDRRMSYTEVRKILQKEDEGLIEECSDFVEMFENMQELASVLRKKRTRRGSIDFDFPETKVLLDAEGTPIEIKAYERNVATSIIEEFMLLANETIAEDFYWQEIPFVYRGHEEPDPEKIKNLSAFIYNFGYHIKGREDVHPRELQKLLQDISGSREEPIISRLTLRSMKKAMYSPQNQGHYGLATEYYTHFTSPIRRYPDLQIHRIIKETINGKMNETRVEHYDKILPGVTKQASDYERRAEEAERESIKLKKVQFMEDKIGNIYEGVISSVTSFGLFIELENTIEGLVHVSTLVDDYYIYDQEKYMYIGERAGNIYALGDVLKVKVVKADRENRTIDFEIVYENEESF